MNPASDRAAPPCVNALGRYGPLRGGVLRLRSGPRLVLWRRQRVHRFEERGFEERNPVAHRQPSAHHPALGFDLNGPSCVRRLRCLGRGRVADQSRETVDGQLGAAVPLDLLEP